MNKLLVAIAATVSMFGVCAQEFPQSMILYCSAGKQSADIEMGRELFDGKGGALRKQGLVGLRWASSKPVWAKPEKSADGSFAVSFPGRGRMNVKQTREIKSADDYYPYVTIQEQGGKTWQCGQSAG